MRVLGIGGQRMNWLHEKKFWRTLFSSYLIILVFSLLMIAFLFRSSLARMEESETASGRTALQKISDSITHMEQELSGVTSSLSARKEYFSLLHAKRDLTSYKLQRVAELQEEQERLEKQLEEKMERWVYLTDLNEQIRAEGRDET